MTPETLKSVVMARLVQMYRQYPRAGLQLSSSCRTALLEIISSGMGTCPDDVNGTMIGFAESDKWTLQARLAWMDIGKYYSDAYESGFDSRNIDRLRAISDAILAAGKIPVGDNVPIRTLPESTAAE